MRTGGSEANGLSSWRWAVTALLPGCPQLGSGGKPRAAVIVGSYLSGVFLACFGWGTKMGLVGAAFAVAVHVASLSDAIARRTFPQQANWRSRAVALFSVTTFIYLPLLFLFSPWLTPVWSESITSSLYQSSQGYLVNRRIYDQTQPATGEWVWIHGRGCRPDSLGVVIAMEGQEIVWSHHLLRVNGLEIPRLRNFELSPELDSLRFKVPEGHVLVATNMTETGSQSDKDWMLVPTSAIDGRVSAQMYPIWERRLLL